MESILNNQTVFILFIALFSALVCMMVLWMIPRLVKRGIDVSDLLEKAGMTVKALDTVADTVKTLMPGAPGLNVVDKILEYANRAVDGAEQMYKASQIPKEKRKEAAEDIVYRALEAAGVEITDEMETVIAGAIEAAVFGLPKTHGDDPEKDE